MRIFASTVGRNEEHRWLRRMLASCEGAFDGHFFYDDQSSDRTLELAETAGCTAVSRPPDVPSFLEHEGQFRQHAWFALEEALKPTEDDWILSIDCDEILLTAGKPDEVLHTVCGNAGANVALLVTIPEAFNFEVTADGREIPLVRTDGYWGTIRGTRLFRYRQGGVFSGKPMGSGSEPQYATRGPYQPAVGLWLMHLGYARRDDQIAKHARYSALMEHGHNDRHVQSIIETPTLVPWEGPWR
jgi:hypothetical protein